MKKIIKINGKKYHLFDSYSTREEAHRIAKYWKKERKTKYMIFQTEEGFFLPEERFHLYLNKKLKIW